MLGGPSILCALFLEPDSFGRDPNSLGVSWVIRASSVLMRLTLDNLEEQAGQQKGDTLIRKLEPYSPTCHPLQRERSRSLSGH